VVAQTNNRPIMALVRISGDPSPLWLMARYSHTRCDLITVGVEG
jgi:hypothetical protein